MRLEHMRKLDEWCQDLNYEYFVEIQLINYQDLIVVGSHFMFNRYKDVQNNKIGTIQVFIKKNYE